MVDLLNAKVYVGTYHKYNEGSLFGKWMKLSDYESKEDFLGACGRLHKNEADPEFMYQDYEELPEEFYRESSVEDVWPFINRVKKWSKGYYAKFLDWCDENGALPTNESIEEFKAAYKANKKPKAAKNESKTAKQEAEAVEAVKTIILSGNKYWHSLAKNVSTAIRLSDGRLVEFSKPKIETSFCFGYDDYGTTYEDARKAEESASTWAYFHACNMRSLDEEIKHLTEYADYVDGRKLSVDWVPYISEGGIYNSIFQMNYDNNFYHKHDHDKIERDDLALIIEVVKSERAKFEKRLQAYWKRYGASKLRTWTYWAD